MTILPNKSYKRDKEIDIQVIIPIGFIVAIIFKILGGRFASEKILLPSLGLIVLVVILSVKKSNLNEGHRCVEQFIIFVKFMYKKLIERIYKYYV